MARNSKKTFSGLQQLIMTKLKDTIQNLGNGSIQDIGDKQIFKLDSYKGNPIVKPQDLGLTWNENGAQKLGAVFNCGAEIFENKIILLPRAHNKYRQAAFVDEKTGKERTCLENYTSEIWPLLSADGLHFSRLKNSVIKGDGSSQNDFKYGLEDTRIIKLKDQYLIVGCGKIKPAFKFTNADRLAIYSTKDFETYKYQGYVNTFDTRNGVPFPAEIAGRLFMLLRFYPNIHLDILEGGFDQLLHPAKHQNEWQAIYERKDKTILFKIGDFSHEKEKIGPGPQVVKTKKGWLMIYHAVGEISAELRNAYGVTAEIPRGYSISAALLDLKNPRKVLARTSSPIYIPAHPYELYGNTEYPIDIPAVVFPVGAVVIEDKLLIYAGAADKYIILLTCSLQKLLNYLLAGTSNHSFEY